LRRNEIHTSWHLARVIRWCFGVRQCGHVLQKPLFLGGNQPLCGSTQVFYFRPELPASIESDTAEQKARDRNDAGGQKDVSLIVQNKGADGGKCSVDAHKIQSGAPFFAEAVLLDKARSLGALS
jgi:hypothetical protein